MADFLKQPVLDALERAGRPLKSKELARELDVPTRRYRAFREFLKGLVASGELYRVKHGRYAPPEKINLVRGSLSVIKSGAAFLVRDGAGDDVFIPADGRVTAFHRDRVVVRIEHTRRGKLEGRVVRVLERAREEFVGTLNKTKHFAFVKADDPRFNRDILIPPDELGDAEDGAKVTAKIIDWGSLTSAPVGSVTEVLGQVGDPGLDILMIIKNNGLPESFPEEVEEAAAKIPDKIPKKEIASRLDLRDVEVVTIDPPTARDFDDALSMTQDKDGNYEIGVHIADVSHYVRHDDIIDREAWNRATSVYLVDRVLPMLPEKLSNNLCSLNPDVDRLAMSAMVTMTPRGRILGYRIEDTVIRSNRRFAYEEVQAYFDGEEGATDNVGEQRSLIDDLRKMAGVLNQKRRLRGALDFDLPSSRVLLDEKGFPTEIKKVVRTESNRLVEEFMLLANEIVAKHLKGLKKPAPYR
ncbi:MAG: RNB domain-containing ribonuclease, partial [Candidatus Eisenbacteria bacterium]|nr:RNB domain-containing ribonuclease [Candidatus Eisenbacteria bacterium]